MSKLKKVIVTVKNFESGSADDYARLYKKVRLLDESGKSVYFKNLIIPIGRLLEARFREFLIRSAMRLIFERCRYLFLCVV